MSYFPSNVKKKNCILHIFFSHCLTALNVLKLAARFAATNDYICHRLICWFFYQWIDFLIWLLLLLLYKEIGVTWISNTALALLAPCVAIISAAGNACRQLISHRTVWRKTTVPSVTITKGFIDSVDVFASINFSYRGNRLRRLRVAALIKTYTSFSGTNDN